MFQNHFASSAAILHPSPDAVMSSHRHVPPFPGPSPFPRGLGSHLSVTPCRSRLRRRRELAPPGSLRSSCTFRCSFSPSLITCCHSRYADLARRVHDRAMPQSRSSYRYGGPRSWYSPSPPPRPQPPQMPSYLPLSVIARTTFVLNPRLPPTPKPCRTTNLNHPISSGSAALAFDLFCHPS